MDEGTTDGMVLSGTGHAALLACGLFTTIGLFSPGLVLPQIERAFAGEAHVALLTQLVGTVASFAFAVGAPIAGSLIGRLGCRSVVPPALALFAAAGAAPALLDDLWLILGARVLLGLALAAIFTGALTGIGALRPRRRMAMFGWFSVVGAGTAIVLFPLIGLIARESWQPAFLVNLSALAVIPLVMLLPASLGRVPRAVAGSTLPAGGLLTPGLIALLGLAALAGMTMLIGPIYAPLYLATIGITDTRLLAVPVTLGSVAGMIASAGYGRFHGMLGRDGVWLLALSIAGAALLLSGFSETMVPFTIGVVLLSAIAAVMAPHVSAVAMAVSVPHRAAQAIGLANGVMFGAQLGFPFIAAWLRAQSGLHGLFLMFGLAMLAAGTLVGLNALRSSRREAKA